jgi:hypothetical protein
MMIRTDEGLNLILTHMLAESIMQFTLRDFQRMCILLRLGRDRRTAKSWINAALAEGAIERTGNAPRGKSTIFKRGPLFEDLLGSKDENTDEGS